MENFENKINNQIESAGILRLRTLENEGKWVFHGSSSKIEVFSPRQAYNYDKNLEKTPDGDPAVFASPFADVAIFKSIVSLKNAPKGARSGFSLSNKTGLEFRATKETLDQIHNAVGYVYVFDKLKFTQRNNMEFLSYNSVAPESVIIVTENDLPKNIEIKDF